MKSNLTTGQVDFVLLQTLFIDRADTPPVRPVRPVKPGGGVIVIPVRPTKEGKGKMLALPAGMTWATPSETLPYETTVDYDISLTIAAHTGEERSGNVDIEYYDKDNNLLYTRTLPTIQDSGLDKILAEDSSNLLTENLDTIVEE
jgi:hypothetical protein